MSAPNTQSNEVVGACLLPKQSVVESTEWEHSSGPPDVTEPATTWAPSIHILELDGLRGLAILIVTIYRFAKSVPDETLLGRMALQIVTLGERGVDLFFVLSGFLITGVLLDSRLRERFFTNFFARRTLRIFPLYFASLFILLIALPAIFPTNNPFEAARQQQLYLWTYLANVRIALEGYWCLGYLDHFWSLAVEEHFYLIWPFAVFALGMNRTFSFAISLAIACAIARITFAAFSGNFVAPDVMSFFRFDGLLLGAAIACWIRFPAGLQQYRNQAIFTTVIFGTLAILLECFTNRLLTISHSVWALFWASVLVVLLTSPSSNIIARTFRNSGLRSLGRYSYAMYVFQNPLIPLVASVWSTTAIIGWLSWNPATSIAPHFIYAAVMFAITYLIAVVSWNVLEKHCLKLKKFF